MECKKNNGMLPDEKERMYVLLCRMRYNRKLTQGQASDLGTIELRTIERMEGSAGCGWETLIYMFTLYSDEQFNEDDCYELILLLTHRDLRLKK